LGSRDGVRTAAFYPSARRGVALRARAARHARADPPGDRRIQFRRPVPAGPVAIGGGLVKAVWFRLYAPAELLQTFDRIVQSWDTANKATELSDFSVCTRWGMKAKDLYLLDVLRRRMEYTN